MLNGMGRQTMPLQNFVRSFAAHWALSNKIWSV